MDQDFIALWAPDPLWDIASRLIPAAPVRPQGGGRRRVDDRRVLAAVLYLTQAGYSWWKLPEELFGVTRATAHRRFAEWSTARLWPDLHQAIAAHLAVAAPSDWPPAVVDAIATLAAGEGLNRGGRGERAGRATRRDTGGLPVATPEHRPS
ncbi:transposase [Planosporangium thailandense]|uniref:Transposase n=1 Tax=Planosporangium thailandense TaxID=765197 RepID=A0ABX0YA09_9ACTN|nr:transposase [Planosporangium thailandense]NJC74049.1 transposase [Planosporangium thailandense]